MTKITGRRALTALRWTARGLGLFLIGLVLMFVIGEGVPNPMLFTGREALQMAGMLGMLAGMALGWRWEGWGGLIVLACFALFAAMGIRLNPVIALFPVPGVLYLLAWRADHRLAGRLH